MNLLRETSLETAIGDEDAGWLVYADWFEEKGVTHRATAMRVLGGCEPKTALEKDASKLVSLVNLWIQDSPDPEAFGSGDVADTRVLSSHEVRDRRPRENIEAWLTLFFEVWGETSPFDEDEALASELEEQSTPTELRLPKSLRFERLSFEHVIISHNGSTGIDGCVFFGDFPREHAAELVFTEFNDAVSGDLDGLEREGPNPYVVIDTWLPLSRANFFSQVFGWRAGNEGRELQRAGKPQPLMPFFKELGRWLEGAWGGDDTSMHAVLRFENAWVTFSATM